MPSCGAWSDLAVEILRAVPPGVAMLVVVLTGLVVWLLRAEREERASDAARMTAEREASVEALTQIRTAIALILELLRERNRP